MVLIILMTLILGVIIVTKELPKVYKLADTYFDHSK